jgi:hypothetical protein
MAKSRIRKKFNRKKKKARNSSLSQSPDYVGAKVDLFQEVSEPSYQGVMDWMRSSGGRSVIFDFWARGNYTRRLIFQRNRGIQPLLVKVSYVDEMRWAYRRLALLGLPVEFIYSGNIPETSRVLHVDRLPRDMIWDAGWGYNATQWEHRGEYNAMLIGNARLMPETLLDWLVDETPEDFAKGKVFVAPAELIGIDSQETFEGLNKLGGITRGAPMTSDYEIARAAIELDIPYLDNMNPLTFKKFLSDYEGELVQFQRAFKRVVMSRGKSEDQLKDYVEELRHEIAELTVAAKHGNTRTSIAKLGGILGTFTVSFTMAIGTQPNSISRLIGAAGIGAATKALLDLWTQAKEGEKAMTDNPYFILWKLGVSRPSEVMRASNVDLVKVPQVSPEQFLRNTAYHWLCPPTIGVWFAGVRTSADT